MSDPQESLKTLSALQREFQAETSKLQQQRSNLSKAIPGREQIVEEHLTRAKNFYKKKEWASAFAEWDQACAYLEESDEFRKKILELRDGHENLVKVNREVLEIKQVLNQRSAPPPADKKFVQGAHDEVSGQVKNVYSYLGKQLRTERTPKPPSLWLPVLVSLVTLALGFAGLYGFYARERSQLVRVSEQSAESASLQMAAMQSERDTMAQKIKAVEDEYEKKIEELRSQNAGWRNAGREKIEELEAQLGESQRQNEALSRRVEKLMEENLKALTS